MIHTMNRQLEGSHLIEPERDQKCTNHAVWNKVLTLMFSNIFSHQSVKRSFKYNKQLPEGLANVQTSWQQGQGPPSLTVLEPGTFHCLKPLSFEPDSKLGAYTVLHNGLDLWPVFSLWHYGLLKRQDNMFIQIITFSNINLYKLLHSSFRLLS